ncbi:HAMP domain-containing sensor histidine kinase [Paraflavisolibacter sp. H34]|uniref:sensor histidine kinase n=1 Tax=Huijunlia imazamoxiresistens TaxID=3127457 RepID=UPI0030170EB8
MFRQFLDWRVLLSVVAILIVSGTVWYSSYLAKKIERDEKQKVEEWVEASKSLLNPATVDTRLHLLIIKGTDIPIIETDEKDSVTNWTNLDSAQVLAGWPKGDRQEVPNQNTYLQKKLRSFRSAHPPIEWNDPLNPGQSNRYYFGESLLLQEVRYYPLAQLLIVGLFITVTLVMLRSSYRSTQNQVWAGMAKETAHQLGTPVSSLEGWIEILKETPGVEKYVPELEKDVTRLRLVSDRFGKIGSKPQLEERNIIRQVEDMVEYIRKRAPGKVSFTMNTHGLTHLPVLISGPLFDWVIENLLKNALDAMDGKGAITLDIVNGEKEVVIDISDTGKGISKQNISRVFHPGFTTKKRGWGLGLSLSRRIIEQYHKGDISVKNSEIGKGTTFRIVLKK